MIISLKLSTSEEIVAKFIEEDENILTVEKPMVMTIVTKGDLGYYHLTPYTYVDKTISFFKHHLIFRSTAYDDLTNVYTKLVSKEMVIDSSSDASDEFEPELDHKVDRSKLH